MSKGEIFAFVVSLAVGGILWLEWYLECFGLARARSGSGVRRLLCAAPLLCAALLFAVLRGLASNDVRDSALYLTFYMVLGAAWVGFAAQFSVFLNLSARDDALERRNPAAAWAIAGGLVGMTLSLAGANIGDGPGWWVVAYCGLLSTGTLFGLWACLEKLARTSELVTVERDVASGVRLAGFMIAEGLILGRAVAGDWESFMATNVDFLRQAWPGLIVWEWAAVFDLHCRPTVQRPVPSVLVFGVAPAALLVGGAVAWVARIGLSG